MSEIWAIHFPSSFFHPTDELICARREASVMMKAFLRDDLLVRLGALALGSRIQKDAAN